jgi:hypothetical protein
MQLAQAYIHLSPYDVAPDEEGRLGLIARRTGIAAAERVYGDNVAVDIRLEEGSLKVWVTVLTILEGLHFTYGTIADYKGFKESVVELCKDAREFGADVCGVFPKKIGASETQVFRTERRLKTPGKIARLISKLDRLKMPDLTLSKTEAERLREQICKELEAVLKDLTAVEAEELQQIVSKGLTNAPPSRGGSQLDVQRVGIRPRFQRTRPLLSQMLAMVPNPPRQEGGSRLIFHDIVVLSGRRDEDGPPVPAR